MTEAPGPTDATAAPGDDAAASSGAPAGDASPTPVGPPDWEERIRRFAEEAPSPHRVELRRASEALRRIIHRLHGSVAPHDEVAGAADELERLAGVLEGFPGGSLYEGILESTLAGTDPHAFFDHSPMLGHSNPLAPPITLWREGDAIHGSVTFGAAYEGPPGCVHGGYVAAAFDELLGATQSLGGRPGMTGHLGVDYRSPTPLHVELTMVGRVVGVEGRKTFTTGTVHAGDRLCAEAQGLFVSVDFLKLADLLSRRDERFGPS